MGLKPGGARHLLLAALLARACYAQQPVTPLEWKSVGPVAVSGGSGTVASGKIQAIAIFASNPAIMYAGGGIGSDNQSQSSASGLYRTTDGGLHWAAANNGLTEAYINAVWVDQTNSDNVVIGTETGGAFRSTDGGQSWTQININGSGQGGSPPGGGAVSNAVSDFAMNGTTLLAAAGSGVAGSSDGGATWTLITKTAARVFSVAAGGGAAAIGTQIGNVLYQSPGGAAFGVILSGAGGTVRSVAVDPATPTTVYAAVGGNTTLQVTTDLKTWNRLAPPASAQAVAVTPTTHTVYLGTPSGLYNSIDGGKTWTSVPTPGWNVRRITLTDESTIILGTDQGAYQSTNGGKQWSSLTGNLPVTVSTGVSGFGPTILTAAEGLTAPVSFDGGATWAQSAGAGQNGAALINPGNPAWCYLFTGVGFEYSSDGCHTFKASAGIGGTSYYNPGGAIKIAVDPSNPANVYVATTQGIYQSSDYGKTMTLTKWGFTNTLSVAVHPTDSSTILVSTISSFSRTRDGGQTWTQVSYPSGAGHPYGIAFNPKNPNIVLAGMSNGADSGGGILKSVDGGITFSLSNTGLPTTFDAFGPGGTATLSVRFSPTGVAAMSNSLAVFISTDAGDSWKNITPGSVNRVFNDVSWDGPYDLYAASWGAGVLMAQPFGPSQISIQTDARPVAAVATYGDTTAVTSIASVTSSTGEPVPFFTLVTLNSGSGWLSVGSTSGTTAGSIGLSVNPSGLNPGTYTGQVSLISQWAENSPLVIPISLTVSPPPGNGPLIYTNGVVPVFSTVPSIAPGSWASIYGINLAPALTIWNNDFPTKLGNVTVTVDSKPAFLWFVSPGQINFQVPGGITNGPVKVVVTTPSGSATATVLSVITAPSLLMFDAKYPAAVIPTGDGTGAYAGGAYDEMGPVGYFPFPARPVKPGETILLYGTGFGGVTGGLPPAGQPFSGALPLTPQTGVTLLMNNVLLKVDFIGLVSAGVYQINLEIPAGTPSGDQVLRLQIGGVNIPGPIYIAVQ